RAGERALHGRPRAHAERYREDGGRGPAGAERGRAGWDLYQRGAAGPEGAPGVRGISRGPPRPGPPRPHLRRAPAGPFLPPRRREHQRRGAGGVGRCGGAAPPPPRGEGGGGGPSRAPPPPPPPGAPAGSPPPAVTQKKTRCGGGGGKTPPHTGAKPPRKLSR